MPGLNMKLKTIRDTVALWYFQYILLKASIENKTISYKFDVPLKIRKAQNLIEIQWTAGSKNVFLPMKTSEDIKFDEKKIEKRYDPSGLEVL